MTDYKQTQIGNFQHEVEERRKNFDSQMQQKRKNLEATNYNDRQEYEKAKKALEDEIREFENQINRDWDELNKKLSNVNEQVIKNNSINGKKDNNNKPGNGHGSFPGQKNNEHNNMNHDTNNNNNGNANENQNNNANVNNPKGNQNEIINKNIAATTIASVPTTTYYTEQTNSNSLNSTSVDGEGTIIIAENEKKEGIPMTGIIILIIMSIACIGFLIIRKKRRDRRNEKEFEYNNRSLQIVTDEPSTDYGKTIDAAPTEAVDNNYYQEYANLMANTYNQQDYQSYNGVPSSPEVDNIYQYYDNNPTTVQVESSPVSNINTDPNGNNNVVSTNNNV